MLDDYAVLARTCRRSSLAPLRPSVKPDTCADLAVSAGDLERLRTDLEDELIRALGVPAVEHFITEQGELMSFRTLLKQPAHRGRATSQQLRRFIGVKAGRKSRYRKSRYAVGLVDMLDLANVPRPLDHVLAHL